MKKILFLNCFLLLTFFNSYSQNLQNGDLEGIITGFSNLPDFWQVVSVNEPHCQATSGGTTPDLVDPLNPSVSAGMIGTPFSGSTFVGGSHGISSGTGTVFQEGIKQNVGGFIIGQTYRISFRQSVVKTSQSIDTSGSWLVLLDNAIIGISAPSISLEPYNSITFGWDSRSLIFTATNNYHDIKFLPLDDDNDLFSNPTNMNGALYMGLDSVNIVPVTLSGIQGELQSNVLSLYPNPTNGVVYIKTSSQLNGELSIFDVYGKLVDKFVSPLPEKLHLGAYQNGFYFLTYVDDVRSLNYKIELVH